MSVEVFAIAEKIKFGRFTTKEKKYGPKYLRLKMGLN